MVLIAVVQGLSGHSGAAGRGSSLRRPDARAVSRPARSATACAHVDGSLFALDLSETDVERPVLVIVPCPCPPIPVLELRAFGHTLAMPLATPTPYPMPAPYSGRAPMCRYMYMLKDLFGLVGTSVSLPSLTRGLPCPWFEDDVCSHTCLHKHMCVPTMCPPHVQHTV